MSAECDGFLGMAATAAEICSVCNECPQECPFFGIGKEVCWDMINALNASDEYGDWIENPVSKTGKFLKATWSNSNPNSWKRSETRYYCSNCHMPHKGTFREFIYSGLPEKCPACGAVMQQRLYIYAPPDTDNYAEYIASDCWRNKSRIVKMLAGYKCKLCGSAKNLVTHHVTYKNMPMEREEDLLCVCERCHKKLHESDLKEKGGKE